MKDADFAVAVALSALIATSDVARAQSSLAVGLSGQSESVIDLLVRNGASGLDRQSLPAIPRSAAVVSAELNGDGRPDFAIGSPAPVNPCLLLSRCDGSYETVILPVDPPAIAGGSLPATADLDGDGSIDVLYTHASGSSGYLLVYLNDGAGHFGNPVQCLSIGNGPRSIAVADFGGSPEPDVAIAMEGGSPYVQVFANDGSGLLTLVAAFDDFAPPKNIATADFDRDGNADVAVTHRSSGDVTVFAGNGAFSFEAGFQAVVPEAWGIVADDFDGDEDVDLGIAGFGSQELSILSNESASSIVFSPAVSPIALGGRAANGIAAFDFDADGHRDLAVALQESDEVVILQGDGTGGFLVASREAVGDAPEYVTAFEPVTSPRLEAVGPAIVWIGLRNSDDIGIRFDLRAELHVNESPVATGQLDSAPGGSSGFNNANRLEIPMTLNSVLPLRPGDVVSFELYVRNAASGSGKNSGTARLWFNDSAADSHADWKIDCTTSSHYLVGEFALSPDPGTGPRRRIDVGAGAPGSPFKLVGIWSVTIL